MIAKITARGSKQPMATIRGFAPQLLPRSTTCGARFGKLWSEKRSSDLRWSVRTCQIVLFTKCKNETMRPIRVFFNPSNIASPRDTEVSFTKCKYETWSIIRVFLEDETIDPINENTIIYEV